MANRPADVARQAFFGFARLLLTMGLLLFLPAWSLNFWQAWTFLFVFSVSVLVITLYFLRRDPRLIERRLKAGPAAEHEKSQKIIQAFAGVLFASTFVVAGFDHHFRWSNVSSALVIAGDLFVVVALGLIFLVFKENSFTSGIIEVDDEQTVISTGPYRIARHPMYAGALLMCLFIPLALGSYYALVLFPPLFVVIVLRLIEEEKFLLKHLPDYSEYRRKTRYRLIPWVW